MKYIPHVKDMFNSHDNKQKLVNKNLNKPLL